MRRGWCGLLTAAVVLCGASSAGAAPSEPEVIASGLSSPRHLDFGSDGSLYVAEAGRGGDGPCFVGGEGPACYGATGAVTRVSRRGGQVRIVDGLASYANDVNENGTTDDDGDSGIGPHGLVVEGGTIYLTNGGPTAPTDFEGNPLTRDDLVSLGAERAGLFGRLLAIKDRGRGHWFGRDRGPRVSSLADIYEFEAEENPDEGPVDTNATDVLLDRGRFVISDAGGNSVLRTGRRGELSTLAVFPSRIVPNPLPFGPPEVDMQAVPTAIVEGPDGAYYMGQLTGFPFPIGGASVYRIDPRTGAASVFATGFTNIMDLAFDKRGTLYVLEIDSNGIILDPPSGAVHSITRRGSRDVVVPPDGTLTAPGGITIGRGGELYVTNNARSPDSGEVLRIER